MPRGSFDWFVPIAQAIQSHHFDEAASLYATSTFLRIDGDSVQQAKLLRIEVPASGHMVNMTAPADFNRALLGFLSATTAPCRIAVSREHTASITTQ
jgi:pimeloyl-ACP methyl ester carboxylesterase